MLAPGLSTFCNVPKLRDISTTIKLLRHLGADIHVDENTVRVHWKGDSSCEAPYELVKQMRASILVLGPLAARFGKARVSLPGGCAIGARPIDQHLKGLEALGATIRLSAGYVEVEVPKGRLHGADIVFDCTTVTGTENLLCAAALAKGRTRLVHAATEPEVQDLAKMLVNMGASIEGIGTDVLVIEGRDELHPVEHAVMPDRIEAGTYMIAAAATSGEVKLEGVELSILGSFVDKLRNAGAFVEAASQSIVVSGKPPFRPTDVVTEPYPGFATDMQAQFMVLMCLAEGKSRMTETVFENRFMHVAELRRMGAHIETRGQDAFVRGVVELQGASVMATDLRASASLVVAGLIAEGMTEVLRVYHLDRGYEKLEQKLKALGADIERVAGYA